MEDWPDDSPQLNPNFKPVRTHFLKLTLENIMNSCLIKIMLKTFKLLNVIFFPLVRNTETAKGVAEGQTPFVI